MWTSIWVLIFKYLGDVYVYTHPSALAISCVRFTFTFLSNHQSFLLWLHYFTCPPMIRNSFLQSCQCLLFHSFNLQSLYSPYVVPHPVNKCHFRIFSCIYYSFVQLIWRNVFSYHLIFNWTDFFSCKISFYVTDILDH